jgi:hypothetical protein
MTSSGLPARSTPHLNKLKAAAANPKASDEDRRLLAEIVQRYREWVSALDAVVHGEDPQTRVFRQATLFNEYKFFVEVECVARRGSAWLKRQKGQLKLDNSIIEEFLIHLVHPATLPGFDRLRELTVGPNESFMSMSFRADSLGRLLDRPEVVVKTKDQDFTLGARLHYAIGTDADLACAVSGGWVQASEAMPRRSLVATSSIPSVRMSYGVSFKRCSRS